VTDKDEPTGGQALGQQATDARSTSRDESRDRPGDRPGDNTAMPRTEEEWRQRLSPERYQVLRNKGTEPAWSGDLLHVDENGIFRCAGCGAELFRSDDKFDSGSGWPSFDRAVRAGTIDEHEDRNLGMVRTEITCARCGGHLGHVFPDGPTDTGLRYCVNSLALDFDPGQGDAGEGGKGRGH
jgi:methionine-R-sulfoxide reductase